MLTCLLYRAFLLEGDPCTGLPGFVLRFWRERHPEAQPWKL